MPIVWPSTILSKFPFEDNMPHSKLESITNGHEDDFWDGEIAVTKGAVGVVINIRGKKVFVATTHLVASYSDSKYTEQRIDQLTQLKNKCRYNISSSPRKN